MKILVIGSGGREHAIVWKLHQDRPEAEIYCAPGNGGIETLATCVPIPATSIEELATWAQDHSIDFTIVGMDDPLMLGIVDAFENKGLNVFGPNKKAALIEGSKVFAKELMKKYDIPTAAYEVFDDVDKAKTYIQTCKYPIVLKADGLALGKGVLICQSLDEAEIGLNTLMVDKKFGAAGNRIVVEEFMTGPEVSVLSFCDGQHVLPMVSAQDHKRAYDHDEGPNTGGMGTFSPSRFYTEEIHQYCLDNIYQKTLDAMKSEGCPFTGILFFGLMLTPEGPKVLEYNARFGDPEAQVVLPRLKSDLVEILEKANEKALDRMTLQWKDEVAVCVVMASGGYPISYKKGYPIRGLDKISESEDLIIFHAGTAKKEDGFVTNGGRVLGLTALGESIEQARIKAYETIKDIDFEGAYYRQDIGIK